MLNNVRRKLDNTARVFSLDYKKNTNIFRYSIILNQNIDKDSLEKVLEKTLKNYPLFKVKLGTGFFWNYLKINPKVPIVKKEEEVLCKSIDLRENNDYLFRITYCKNKINLDFFHVLTDGVGAMKFLRSIVYNYLDLKNDLMFSEYVDDSNISYQDQYLENYDKNLKEKINFKRAYSLSEKIYKNINNTYHYIIDIGEIKNVCRYYNVTITEYLTAIYVYAIYLSFYKKKSKKEIVIAVPVDLRKYYQVDTLYNFFVCMYVNPKILEKKLTTFDEILNEIHDEFKEKLKEKTIKKCLARDVKIGQSKIIGLIPLSIKKLFMRYLDFLAGKMATSTLSNVGVVDIDDKYKKYINNILVSVLPNEFQNIKCTICSFDKKLNVTINDNIDDIIFHDIFLKLMKKNISNIELLSSSNV